MLILASLAHAHLPHDTVTGVAAPPGLGADLPWWLLGGGDTDTMLLRSDDQGVTWHYVGGPPLAESLQGIARLSDETVVLLGEDRYWWSRDGEEWGEEVLPGSVWVAGGGDWLVLGGPGGLWEGPPGGLAQVSTELVTHVGPGRVAITDGSAVLRGDDGWAATAGPGTDLRSVAYGDNLYAGDDTGQVWRWSDSAWVACGALPAGEHPAVVTLAVAAGVVTAATGDHAGWVSTDACATWQDRGPDVDALYGVTGGVGDDAEAWPVLGISGYALVVGGWAGLYTSTDAGETWSDAALIGADFTRGMAFSSAFAEDGLFYWGGYGAGVLRTADGGSSFDAPAHGLTSENVQRVTTVAGEPNVILAVAGHSGWRSDDYGSSWTAFGDRDVMDFHVWGTSDDIWVFSLDTISATTDGGDTWETLAVDGVHPVGATEVGGTRCMTSLNPAEVLCEVDGAWTVQLSSSSGTISLPERWPGASSTRLLVGDDYGIHYSDDAGETWTTTFEADDPVTLVSRADDDTLLFTTRTGRLGTSLDGGETWVVSDWHLSDTPHVLVARPGFAEHPDVLMGSHDGVWISRHGAAPERFAALQRIDDASAYWEEEGLAEHRTDTTASMDSILPMPAGGRISAWMRGSRLRVLGTTDGSGRVVVSVDGVEVATLGESGSGGFLGEVSGFADGWHWVEIAGVTAGVEIDAVEAWGEGVGLDEEEEGGEETGETGETGEEETAVVITGETGDSAEEEEESGVGGGEYGGGCPRGCGGGASALIWIGVIVGGRRRR